MPGNQYINNSSLPFSILAQPFYKYASFVLEVYCKLDRGMKKTEKTTDTEIIDFHKLFHITFNNKALKQALSLIGFQYFVNVICISSSSGTGRRQLWM